MTQVGAQGTLLWLMLCSPVLLSEALQRIQRGSSFFLNAQLQHGQVAA